MPARPAVWPRGSYSLDEQRLGLCARIILTSFFWLADIITLLKPAGVLASVERSGLPKPRLVVATMVVTELGGSALLIGDVRSLGWLGAGWLGVFTFPSIPLGHPFWKFPLPKRMEDMQIALEHVAVIGGLMCAAALLRCCAAALLRCWADRVLAARTLSGRPS